MGGVVSYFFRNELPSSQVEPHQDLLAERAEEARSDVAFEEKEENFSAEESPISFSQYAFNGLAIVFALYCTTSAAASDGANLMMSRTGNETEVYIAFFVMFLSSFGLSFEEVAKNIKSLFSCRCGSQSCSRCSTLMIVSFISSLSAACAFFQSKYGVDVTTGLHHLGENTDEFLGTFVGIGNAATTLLTGGASLFKLAAHSAAGESIWEHGSPFSAEGFYLGYFFLAQAGNYILQDMAAAVEVLGLEGLGVVQEYLLPLIPATLDAIPTFIFTVGYYIERLYYLLDLHSREEYLALIAPFLLAMGMGGWLEYLNYSSNFNTYMTLFKMPEASHFLSGITFLIAIFCDTLTLDHALRFIGASLFQVNQAPQYEPIQEAPLLKEKDDDHDAYVPIPEDNFEVVANIENPAECPEETVPESQHRWSCRIL
ncbi:MAG: hypothetical protein SFW66_03425 [Gammaproteobacteria bacterium]|nr:hypothetical protein [Gammaproteobacteria bacterium]